ncbi:hypothetical protein TOPH_06332 [Tolypocladium ophioglossoides CBS 100239]|uniref:Uncharacterized protein n=1 Tax=Tolypocladium ophioglossoides (strain CBS 100239) TaxID=1163406 RepID=A0A0L0N4L6_TOLOC|nr:hypothetical protein TOPH_06332 [Tolypocladium ophioglossoides CBS 100239]
MTRISGERDARFNKLSLDCLPGRHRDVFSRALSNVLYTEIAELTYAQIVDGLPLSSVQKDAYDFGLYLPGRHPLHDRHTELCPGVLERTRQIHREFSIESLECDSRLMHAYMAGSPGSRAFQTRLIELVAVAVHSVAVELHKKTMDTNPHKGDELSLWTPPTEDEVWWEFHPDGAPPTLFRHEWYCNYDQYPQGVSDGVGYWAEARILGGVVLFDRRDPEADGEAEPNAIYSHSDRQEVTYRIWQLLDSQKQRLLDFLQSEHEDVQLASPLPILCSDDNRRRIDLEEPIELKKIYRDIWERRPLSPNDPDRRLRDVYTSLDWPTFDDWNESRQLAFERKWEIDYPDYTSGSD